MKGLVERLKVDALFAPSGKKEVINIIEKKTI
jgi:hypothetical protein